MAPKFAPQSGSRVGHAPSFSLSPGLSPQQFSAKFTGARGTRMRPMQQRGVPFAERDGTGNVSATPDWEAVRIFLEVARRGSFRSAADHLALSINALRRRISELESKLGVTLFTRHVDGVRPTAEGSEMLVAARKMELASFGLIRARDRSDPSLAGEVKLAVTEGLGTFWLAPRLVEFQRSHPKLLVDLNCAMQSADVLRLEA